MLAFSGKTLVPARRIIPPRLCPQPETWSDSDLTIAWLGHASFLINFFGTKILLDPALGPSVGLSPFGDFTIGVTRYVEAPLKAQDIGAVDLILVSHAHTDHFDYPTLRQLQNPRTIAVTAKNTSKLWRGLNYHVVELHWGEEKELAGVRVRALEGRHWGARLPWYKGMEANSLLLSKNGVHVFFGGDTGYTDRFARQLAGIPVDVAILGIAAYSPKSLEAHHATPEQAWQMAKEIGAKWVIPMHWGTFRLSREPMEEPMKRFRAVAADHFDRVVIQEIGATWVMPK